MATGVSIRHKRKASNFVAGELAAGEMGLNTITGEWFFSLDGASVHSVSGVRNQSVADQTINANQNNVLLTNSTLPVPVSKLQIGTVFKFRLVLSKTAAGTNANTFVFRLGTTGTNSDPAILTFTLPSGTAVIDSGQIEITVTIRGPLSASCIAQGVLVMVHNLSATGLATVPCVVLRATSAAFNATTAGLIASLTCSTAASTVLTFHQIVAEVINL